MSEPAESDAGAQSDYPSAPIASFLGWTLGAVDGFILVFVLPTSPRTRRRRAGDRSPSPFARSLVAGAFYANPMALTALTVFTLGAVVAGLGRERKGAAFGA
jgi:hypothetical protein